MDMDWRILSFCFLLMGASTLASSRAFAQEADPNAVPGNLAPQASITADSEFDARYAARFVADGALPTSLGRDDVGMAWAVNGATFGGEATITFEWPAAVRIGEIIVYGRTAWMMTECWKDYEILVGDATEPVLRGTLAMAHGPQRITLPEAVSTTRLAIHFTSTHGPGNTGASEIQIFSEPPSDEDVLLYMKRQEVGPYYLARDREMGEHPDSLALREALLEGGFGFEDLLVVQRREVSPSHVYTYHVEGLGAGGALCVLTPTDGEPVLREIVASPDGIILDCDLSFDANQVLFSWRRNIADSFHIYCVDIDGANLRRLTEGDSNNVNPCWLPDGGIAFLSDRKPAYAYCFFTTSPILHRMDADGANVTRLSGNYLNDFTPSVLNDGSLIYSRWEYVDRPAIPIQSLWTINPDGSTVAAYFGNRVLSPATFMEARAIPGSTNVLCVMTAHNGPCRGAVGLIDPTLGINAQEAIRNLTPEIDIGKVDKGSGNDVKGPFESPYPIDSDHFLVSRRGTLLLRNLAGDAETILAYPDQGLGIYGARPLAARSRPPVRRSALAPNAGNEATLFVRDVYRGLGSSVQRGEIKEIRVVQEVEKSRLADHNRRAFGFQFPVVSCGATYAPKRVWGRAKVYADGSACFKVPTGIPLYFMVLDAEGRAVQRMRSFTHFMPGETQGCVGCHEHRDDAPPSTARPMAYAHGAQDLTPPEWIDDRPDGMGFSYARVVQPVLDARCVSCHGPEAPEGGLDLSSDRTDFFSVSYDNLARRYSLSASLVHDWCPPSPDRQPLTSWIPTYNGQEENILNIAPKAWGSYASTLGMVLTTDHADAEGESRVEMTAAEKRRLYAWMDLNVPYYGASLSNHPDRKGCRRMLPEQLDTVLADVAERRCVSCHETTPRDFFVRVESPERNAFLDAPLAKAAGGDGRCGEAVFATRDDPDYQAILDTFGPVEALLLTTPRLDMPGGEAVLSSLPAESCLQGASEGSEK